MWYLQLLLSFFLFLGCEKASEKNAENKSDTVLNIAVSSDYPPFIYNKDNKLEGFEIEIINIIAKSLNKTIHFHDIAFEGLLQTVAEKQVDGAIATISKTPEREKNLDFTIPYHRSITVIVVPFATSINKLEDIDGKVVGVEAGTTYEHELINRHYNVQLLKRIKFSELLPALHEDKCQAIVTGYSEAYELQNLNPNLKIIPIEDSVSQFSIALPKGSPLLEPINKKLQEMIQNGDIQALERQYFKKIVVPTTN